MTDNSKASGVREITSCRICGREDLAQFLDLGLQPLANSFLTKDQLSNPEQRYPLRVMFCQGCGLVQLRDIVDPELLFRDYVYFSSGMPASKHFRAYAQSIVADFTHRDTDLVVEIGSNDGHFLAVVKELGRAILGVDPAQNIAADANSRGILTLPEFFSQKIANDIVAHYGAPKVVVGNNVVAHINNHHDLVTGITTLIGHDGVFVFEAPYLVDMFEQLSFDTIYHEHLSYLAVRPLQHLFNLHGLDIFDVQLHPIQGNSLRVFVGAHGARPIAPSVQACLQREHSIGLDRIEPYIELAQKIVSLKNEVMSVLRDLKSQGHSIAGYGAPAKGNTLLNYYGIGTDILEYVTEELPSKIGLYTPGTHIPVANVSLMRANPPEYSLLLAWNYQRVILEKEKSFRDRGGQFIMPIGAERII